MKLLKNIENRFRIPRIVIWIEKYPIKAFAIFLLFHGVLWTLLPTFFFELLHFNILEGLMYGREWQLGYDKHPPLPWYLIEAAHQLIDQGIAYYALSQISVLIAFIFVFAKAVPIVGYFSAFASVLIIDGAIFFNVIAV